MKSFAGRIAVVTGGGTGMGRELVRQLAEQSCRVAMCDVSADAMAETRELCAAAAPDTQVSTFVADVAEEAQMLAFAAHVASVHDTDHVNLLFNNAGISGGGSFVTADRGEWERTFNICWGGVYLCTRAFLPMLMAASEGHVINTSSVNGFWASLGPATPHTAYSAAKFAVKGFTEALVNDFRLHAPHLRASVVMPGHIGTSIAINSFRMHGRSPETLTGDQLAEIRADQQRNGIELGDVSDDDLRAGIAAQLETFRDAAPMTAADAAGAILDGVRAQQWRILVGEDAKTLDRLVRESPEDAYEVDFVRRVAAETTLRPLGPLP